MTKILILQTELMDLKFAVCLFDQECVLLSEVLGEEINPWFVCMVTCKSLWL